MWELPNLYRKLSIFIWFCQLLPDKVKSIADIKKQLLGWGLGLGLGSIIVAVDNCKLSGIQWCSYLLLQFFSVIDLFIELVWFWLLLLVYLHMILILSYLETIMQSVIKHLRKFFYKSL